MNITKSIINRLWLFVVTSIVVSLGVFYLYFVAPIQWVHAQEASSEMASVNWTSDRLAAFKTNNSQVSFT